jgi:hypothetical protein
VLAILALVLGSLSRPGLTLDPLIAEANRRARKRQALVRLVAAAPILGAAFAGAAFLQHQRYSRQVGVQLVSIWRLEHPWWVYAATLALCLLGVAGAAGVLGEARRAVAIGHTVASALFLASGVAALTDTGLYVSGGGGVLDRTDLAVALLLLGAISSALARTFWSSNLDSFV